MPFKRAYEMVKRGDVDGVFNFYKTKERLKNFDYTEPIIKNSIVFFVRKDSTIKYENLSDLKGINIGIVRGYTYGKDFDNSTLFTKQVTNSHRSNLKKLAVGRIDAYPCDKLVGIR